MTTAPKHLMHFEGGIALSAFRSQGLRARLAQANPRIVGVSALVVVIGLPLWLLIALAIKLDSRGPVLYRDRRIGVGEREFGMLKFRTMVQGAAEQQAVLEDHNEAGGALFKIRDDPRRTRVGRWLRRFSLYELPQIAHVLSGRMSLVGPRPFTPEQQGLYAGGHAAAYYSLRPGLSGLWQVSRRNAGSFSERVAYDDEYSRSVSLWSDALILWRTVLVVLRATGI